MIAGGGTGGHVLAGIAVAQAWMTAPDSEVLFVGGRGGIEERLVPKAGFRLETVSIGALNHVGLQKRLKTAFQLPLAFFKALWILARWRPSAVLGVGGYASGPVVLLASWLGMRTAILEQNSISGLTNRWLGRFARQVFLAFPLKHTPFAREKLTVTGNPVRKEMTPLPEHRRSDRLRLFVFGGSQGALGINSLVIDALPALQARVRDGKLPPIEWIHQTGEKDFDRVQAAHAAAGTGARVEKFVYAMRDAYEQSALILCRAGSSTLSELAAVGRASILIPFPLATDNHQEANARIFTEAGAAILLRQQEAKSEDLVRVIQTLWDDPARISEMENRVRAFYKPEAARDIATALARDTG